MHDLPAPRPLPHPAPPPPVGSDRMPFRGPLESAFRHPFLVALPVVLLIGAAIAIGLLRSPTYTSEARVNVGRADVPAFTLQGVIIGNATLAAGYARAISAERVLAPAARAGGVSIDEARSRLSASPVPTSTLIRVEAEGDSERQATALANAGANGLVAYVRYLTAKQQASGVLQKFRRAQAVTDQKRRRFRQLLRRLPGRSREAEQARLDLLTAQYRSQALSTQYIYTQSNPTAGNDLQVIVAASHASSDFGSVLQRLVLIALAAGIVVGLALALLRANWGLLRRSRA